MTQTMLNVVVMTTAFVLYYRSSRRGSDSTGSTSNVLVDGSGNLLVDGSGNRLTAN